MTQTSREPPPQQRGRIDMNTREMAQHIREKLAEKTDDNRMKGLGMSRTQKRRRGETGWSQRDRKRHRVRHAQFGLILPACISSNGIPPSSGGGPAAAAVTATPSTATHPPPAARRTPARSMPNSHGQSEDQYEEDDDGEEQAEEEPDEEDDHEEEEEENEADESKWGTCRHASGHR
jgi:hypothetical protein